MTKSNCVPFVEDFDMSKREKALGAIIKLCFCDLGDQSSTHKHNLLKACIDPPRPCINGALCCALVPFFFYSYMSE